VISYCGSSVLMRTAWSLNVISDVITLVIAPFYSAARSSGGAAAHWVSGRVGAGGARLDGRCLSVQGSWCYLRQIWLKSDAHVGGRMRYPRSLAPLALLIVGLVSTAQAQERPYAEGNVIVVSYIRVKPGMFDKYVKYLDTDYKKVMEAAKKSGVIVDYGVYTTPQEHEGDWNMVLRVVYKNMAALDNLRDKMEPIQHGVTNMSPDQAAQASIDRGAMRDAVGGRMFREIILK
jgi:hypothetical protein